MVFSALGDRGVPLEIIFHAPDTVDGLVSLPDEAFLPPTIRTFAVDRHPQKVIVSIVGIQLRLLPGGSRLIAVGDPFVVFPGFLAMEIRNLLMPPSVVSFIL